MAWLRFWCASNSTDSGSGAKAVSVNPSASHSSGQTGEFQSLRLDMVEKQLRRRGITDQRVINAMAAVPRHEFVPEPVRDRAYADVPLPIGQGQTISQPYIVAAMTAALHLTGDERVLEVGSGSGYQAAVLSQLAKEVFTIEVREELAAESAGRLARLGFAKVHVRHGDGTLGLPEFALYGAILVAAAAPGIPPPLLEQLALGGRLVVPVGSAENQELRLLTRTENGFVNVRLDLCRFVPLIGYYGWQEHRRDDSSPF